MLPILHSRNSLSIGVGIMLFETMDIVIDGAADYNQLSDNESRNLNPYMIILKRYAM